MSETARSMEAMIAEAVAERLRPIVREELEAALGSLLPGDLDTAQAARLAGVQPKTVREWVAEGRLHATRRGRALRISREDLARAVGGDSPEPSDAAAQALRSLRGGLG